MPRAPIRKTVAQKSPYENQTGTASPDEVARFAAMASEWWDPNGKFRPLHMLNPLRIGFIRDHGAAHFGRDPLDNRPLAGLKVLDIGCGGGLLSEPLCRLGARVTGIDAAEENVKTAAHHARESGLDITYRSVLPEDLAEDLAEDAAFDFVLNMEVIEHVADVARFLEASARLVRPGGAMVLSTINRTLKSLALAKVGAEYVLRWLPAGTHDWRKFVRPSELVRGLEPHGFRVTDLKGMIYNPVSGTWSLGRDMGVNYLVFAEKRPE